MDYIDTVELDACPECGGPAVLELEAGWCCYVVCSDCGSHTAEIEYTNDEELKRAIDISAELWNLGKAVPTAPGS